MADEDPSSTAHEDDGGGSDNGTLTCLPSASEITSPSGEKVTATETWTVQGPPSSASVRPQPQFQPPTAPRPTARPLQEQQLTSATSSARTQQPSRQQYAQPIPPQTYKRPHPPSSNSSFTSLQPATKQHFSGFLKPSLPSSQSKSSSSTSANLGQHGSTARARSRKHLISHDHYQRSNSDSSSSKEKMRVEMASRDNSDDSEDKMSGVIATGNAGGIERVGAMGGVTAPVGIPGRRVMDGTSGKNGGDGGSDVIGGDVGDFDSEEAVTSSNSNLSKRSTGEDWVRELDTHVRENNRAKASPDESPYYIAHKSIWDNPTGARRRIANYHSTNRVSTHHRHHFHGRDPSESPPDEPVDFWELNAGYRPVIDGYQRKDSDQDRSIIDDLTVQNQRLKKRLRRYEKPAVKPFNNHKMFEVIASPSMPLELRKELDSVLQTFARECFFRNEGLDADNADKIFGDELKEEEEGGRGKEEDDEDGLGISPADGPPPHKIAKVESSQPRNESTTTFQDSAYASGSGTGRSRSRWSSEDRSSFSSRTFQTMPRLRNLHLAESPEKAKMRVVVKRLEEIFTGREDVSGNVGGVVGQAGMTTTGSGLDSGHVWNMSNGQPIPEENGDVTQPSVVGKTDVDGLGNEEGAREAPIKETGDSNGNSSTDSLVDTGNASLRPHQLDQRPTRPADFKRDTSRKQNMDYIRHLTSTKDSQGDDATTPGMHGNWVYLNLITNMAQLHSLNVTRSFVKNAVQHCSTKLELSPDGSKIRWKNGYGNGNGNGSGSGSGSDGNGNKSADSGENGSSGSKSGESNTIAEGSNQNSSGVSFLADKDISMDSSSDAKISPGDPSPSDLNLASVRGQITESTATLTHQPTFVAPDGTAFPYIPLYTRPDSEDDTTPADSDEASEVEDPTTASRGGSVVFFGIDAPFFMDFGFAPGIDDSTAIIPDTGPNPNQASTTANTEPHFSPAYRELLTRDWSSNTPEAKSGILPSDIFLPQSSTQQTNITPETNSTQSPTNEDSSDELQFHPPEPFPTALELEKNEPWPPKPMPLQASGIGPIVLADNYAVFTKTRHFSPYRPPEKVAEIRVDLPPSELPPALFLADSDSEEDDDDDDDDDESGMGEDGDEEDESEESEEMLEEGLDDDVDEGVLADSSSEGQDGEVVESGSEDPGMGDGTFGPVRLECSSGVGGAF